MAGHSKFKNIQYRKGSQDQKKAKNFTKLINEIIIAVKANGSDPKSNPRLRKAISLAKSYNLPKERINNALNQLKDTNSSNPYKVCTYEGFLSGGIAVIIDCFTDNKNRTASKVRSYLSQSGGNLAKAGSVKCHFEQVGKIVYPTSVAETDQMMELSIQGKAKDITSNESNYIIYTDINLFLDCSEYLSRILGNPLYSEREWLPKSIISIDNEENAKNLLKVIETLENTEDIQRVFSNYKISEELYKKLSRV